jgi:hypothetical protein
MLRSDLPQGAESGWVTLFCRAPYSHHHIIVHYSTGVLGFWNGGFYGSSFTPQLDVWHNLTAVYNRDSPGSVAMHVNGQWVYRGGEGFDTAQLPLNIIGNRDVNVDQYARGWIRNVAIYPYGITDSEITAWNSPSGTPTLSSTSLQSSTLTSTPTPTPTSTLTPTLTPTPTPFCPPARFRSLPAHGLAGTLLTRTPATPAEQDCATACCLDPACEGYSYAPATPPLVCALYANVSGAVPNILVDSGVLRTALDAVAAGGGTAL